MGSVPQPPRLSREEFDRRFKAGARSLEELDPDFVAWVNRGRFLRATLASVWLMFALFILSLFLFYL